MIVDDDTDPAHLAQLLLHLREPLPIVHLDTRGPARMSIVVFGVVRADHDARHALCIELARQRRDVEQPGDVLPAGHRHRGVVEDLERDVDAGSDARADREDPRVAQGPIAQVLEEVGLGHERSEPDPRHAFGAHRRRRQFGQLALARLEIHDAVATDAAADERALGHQRRAVVRAAAAVFRGSGGRLERDHLQAVGARASGELRQHAREHAGDLRRIELAHRRHERAARAIALAGDAHAAARFMQDRAQLHLDERALLFDHNHGVDRTCERDDRLLDQRIGQRQLEQAHTAARGRCTEIDECLKHVEVGLACCHDAQPGARRSPAHAIEAVLLRVGASGSQPRVRCQQLLLGDAVRSDHPERLMSPGLAVDHELRLRGKCVARAIERYAPGAIGHRGHDLQAHERSGMPRHRERMDAERQHFLRIPGVQHRDTSILKGVLTVAR